MMFGDTRDEALLDIDKLGLRLKAAEIGKLDERAQDGTVALAGIRKSWSGKSGASAKWNFRLAAA